MYSNNIWKIMAAAMVHTSPENILPFCYAARFDGIDGELLVLDKRRFEEADGGRQNIAFAMSTYGWDYSNYDKRTLFIRRTPDGAYMGLMSTSPAKILSERRIPAL